MSTCISGKGEFSSHTTSEGNYLCDDCGSLDEDGIFAELDSLRARVSSAHALADDCDKRQAYVTTNALRSALAAK